MTNWQEFIGGVPERVRVVIEEGPTALTEYPGKVTRQDKELGLVKYKGGEQLRGWTEPNMKSGKRAVVYFDPAFCVRKDIHGEVPDEVMENHSDEEVKETFVSM